MGCMGSRFDKRKDAAGDFNTSGIQFMGGEGSLPDGCPVDRLVMAYTEKKELADVFKADDEDLAKKIATETYNGCDQQSKYLIGANGEPVDGKKVLISDKYDLKDAIANLKSVMDALKAAGFEFAEEKKEEGKEEEKKDDMMAEPEMMEGGEDMEGMMDAMMAAAGDLYADDAEDYNGCPTSVNSSSPNLLRPTSVSTRVPKLEPRSSTRSMPNASRPLSSDLSSKDFPPPSVPPLRPMDGLLSILPRSHSSTPPSPPGRNPSVTHQLMLPQPPEPPQRRRRKTRWKPPQRWPPNEHERDKL